MKNTLHQQTTNTLPAFIAVFMLASGTWFTIVLFLNDLNFDTPADSIEAIGSLFSAIAVGVAIVSLYWQQHNFKNQLSELEHGSFNNTFCMLIELHDNAARSISHKGKSGQECFKTILTEFAKKRFFNDIFPDTNNIMFNMSAYQQALEPMHSAIFSYLNTTSLILRLINQDAPENKKDIYISIFTSKLTKHELALLMYHAIFSGMTEDIKDIANTFSIFRTIKDEAMSATIQKYYSPSAFGLSSWDTSE